MDKAIQENTQGIKTTGVAIDKNTAAVTSVTQNMESLESTLQQVNSLSEPISNLAALGIRFHT